MGCGVWGVGCGVWGVGCGVWGVGCGVWGVGFGDYRQPHDEPHVGGVLLVLHAEGGALDSLPSNKGKA